MAFARLPHIFPLCGCLFLPLCVPVNPPGTVHTVPDQYFFLKKAAKKANWFLQDDSLGAPPPNSVAEDLPLKILRLAGLL